MNGTIYMFVNKINNKKYIGQTKYLRRRLKVHVSGDGSPLLKAAITKYGIDSFEIHILESDIKDQDQLDSLEEQYITKYNSLVPNGYNIRTGKHDGVKDTRLTKEQEQYIIEMYQANIKVKEISKRIGMSIGGIVKALERNSIPRRKPISKDRESKIDYDLIVKLISEGKSSAEIAKIFNTNYKYIWKYRKSRGI